MILELREYVFAKNKWPEYWSLFNELCLPTRKNDFGKLQGMWLHDGEGEVRFFHLWQYDSLNDRSLLRSQLASVPVWKNSFLPQAATTLSNQYIRILNQHQELNPSSNELVQSIAIYECKPGQVGELIKFIKRNDRDSVAIWHSEFGNPNEVIVLRNSTSEYDERHYQVYANKCHLVTAKAINKL